MAENLPSEGWTNRHLEDLEAKAKKAREWRGREGKPKEWTFDQPIVVPHKTGAVSPRGYAKGQLEIVGRGSRGMSRPADREKVPLKNRSE